MHNWPQQLSQLLKDHPRLIMVTVVQTKGSTPREQGARFYVLPTQTFGTIGGGNLEYQATKIARDILNDTDPQKLKLQHFSLAAGLGMCCGGVVELLFEVLGDHPLEWLDQWIDCCNKQLATVLITRMNKQESIKKIYLNDDLLHTKDELPKPVSQAALQLCDAKYKSQKYHFINVDSELYLLEAITEIEHCLYLFGAGHVGQAVVTLMQAMPWRIKWVDTRDAYFESSFFSQLPPNVDVCITDTPEAEIAQAHRHGFFLVMTHDHSLDLVLCEHILKRDDAYYLGVIGSKTKRQRFEHRLAAMGLTHKQLKKMVCPIGIGGINSKQASIIAVSVVAQLLQQAEIYIDNHSIQSDSLNIQGILKETI